MSITVSLHNAEEITGQIRSVRDDASPTNWVLVGHFNEDPNVLTLVGSGSGGLAEMKAKMSNAQVQYGLLRVTTQVDLSKTTKFCYIYNLGEKVSFVKKGKFGVVKGQATKHFQPYHVDFEIQSPEEIEEQDVLKKVSEAAGEAASMSTSQLSESVKWSPNL
ncbi:hypothetical protein HK102_010815 [Quaeritorhiza haematococci]|nr:hypothetical protein HK102_010815 [Quaeritorhiza haematococci]